MIEWLWQQSLVVTLVIAAILVGKSILHKKLGSLGFYQLWLLVPVSLALSFIPIKQYGGDTEQVQAIAYTLKQVSHGGSKAIVDYSAPLLILWLVGTIGFLTLIFFSHQRFIKALRLRKVSPPWSNSGLTVFETDQPVSPFISGLFSARLILPRNFSRQYSEQQQNLVIEHEYCHFYRGDLWWNCLALLLLAVFWFNPICYLAYREFRQAQEWACDQAVLKGADTQQRVAYGNAMLLNAHNWRSVINPSVNFGDKEIMLKRLNNIKTDNAKPVLRTIAASVTVVVALLFGHSVVAGNTESAIPLKRAEPVYPKEAAQQSVQGYVELKFTVDANGRTKNIVVTDSQPKDFFDKAARKALREWVYQAPGKDIHNQLVRLDFALEPGETSSFDGSREVIQVNR